MVVAPMSRHRAALSGVPTELNVEYYRQRASAGLIVTEGTAPSAMSRGYLFTPGLYEDAHVEGWRRVTDAVHGGGGTIFVQLMHAGSSGARRVGKEGASTCRSGWSTSH